MVCQAPNKLWAQHRDSVNSPRVSSSVMDAPLNFILYLVGGTEESWCVRGRGFHDQCCDILLSWENYSLQVKYVHLPYFGVLNPSQTDHESSNVFAKYLLAFCASVQTTFSQSNANKMSSWTTPLTVCHVDCLVKPLNRLVLLQHRGSVSIFVNWEARHVLETVLYFSVICSLNKAS